MRVFTRVTHTILFLVLAVAWPHAYAAQQPAVNPNAQVLQDFKARVDKYVELRNKADDSAPPMKKTDDSAELRSAQQGLAERIGAARTPAKQGDIFTPEIAAQFRKLLRPEVNEPGTKATIKDDNPGASPSRSTARIRTRSHCRRCRRTCSRHCRRCRKTSSTAS